MIMMNQLSAEDITSFQEFSYLVYFEHLFHQHREMAERALEAAETFKRKKFENDIQKAKYLFLKFALGSFCEIIYDDDESNLPTNVDDPNFDLNAKFKLEILSKSGEKYVLLPEFYQRSSAPHRVLIFIESLTKKGEANTTVDFSVPVDIVYLRKLWSNFEIRFHKPMFERLQSDRSILSSKVPSRE